MSLASILAYAVSLIRGRQGILCKYKRMGVRYDRKITQPEYPRWTEHPPSSLFKEK